jgi:hypothetical protein
VLDHGLHIQVWNEGAQERFEQMLRVIMKGKAHEQIVVDAVRPRR